MIKLHCYPDGLTGLAAFCDVCGEQITKNDGYVVWNEKDGQVNEWRVIHQARCDDRTERKRWPMSMALDVELVYLANSAGVDLEKAGKHAYLMDMIS